MLRDLSSWLRGLETRRFNRRVQAALKLHMRGEVRSDGLPLKSAQSSLHLEWRARDIHPWDKTLRAKNFAAQFVNQAITDTVAVLSRLFATLPHVDVIAIGVYDPSSDRMIMSGEVLRADISASRPVSDRMWLSQLGVSFYIVDNCFQPLSRDGDLSHSGVENHCV